MPLPDVPVADRHRKQLAVMRGYLEGRRYYQALEALEVVRAASAGTRKDGVTPKFHHQLSVVRLLSTLEPSLLHPEATLATGFLHDHIEDHDCPHTTLAAQFGAQIADATWTLSKKGDGMTRTSEAYYRGIARDPIGSAVKPADRNHNLQTMGGVWTPGKQLAYVAEVDLHYYDLIKAARRRFPQQFPAYENLRILLRCQCRLIRQIHAERDEATPPTTTFVPGGGGAGGRLP